MQLSIEHSIGDSCSNEPLICHIWSKLHLGIGIEHTTTEASGVSAGKALPQTASLFIRRAGNPGAPFFCFDAPEVEATPEHFSSRGKWDFLYLTHAMRLRI